MKFSETSLKGVHLVEIEPITDERGWFGRTFCKKEFAQIGFSEEFVQMNQSYNVKKGTWRGLHYQTPPWHETKLIRCISGRVMDYVVDLRKNSKTFLKPYSIELSAKNFRMILIPGGFAHGFFTLEPDSVLLYNHTQYFEKGSERGIRHDDPRLQIELPAPIQMVSERDRSYDFLPKDFEGII